MNHCCAICRDGLSENPAEFTVDLKSCPLNAIIGTPCRHVFHCYCLAKWLEFQEEATIAPSCPACRHPVPLIDILGNVREPNPKYIDVILIRIGDSSMIATTLDNALALITLQLNRSLEANALEFEEEMKQRQAEFDDEEKRHRSHFQTVVGKWEREFNSWEAEEQKRNESSRYAVASNPSSYYRSYNQSGANDTVYMIRKSNIRDERKKFDKEMETVRRDFNLNASKRAKNFEAWKKDCKVKNERQRTEFAEAVLSFQRDLARSSF